MLRILFINLFIIGFLQYATCQPNITIQNVPSAVLKSTEQVQVYLPADYNESGQDYPVLYILDGHWFFYNGVAIQETLKGDSFFPDMIVIGIDLKSRAYHDSLLFNHWNELSTYVAEELVQFVDQNYRTNEHRIVYGWENPAFLVCEFLFTASPVFSGYIASNGGNVEDTMIDAFEAYQGEPKYLYLTNSKKDIFTLRHSDALAEKLKQRSYDQLKWTYELFNTETHESLPYLSLYHGLKYYYHNYSSKVFSNIKEFNDEGGLVGLTQYFKERGERFGLDTAIDDGTKNSLIWLAWKHDQFESFEMFMTEFSEVLSTKRYASAYWQNRLGQFYLKYEDLEHAAEYFNRGIEEYPDDRFLAQMYSGLGTTYQKKGNKRLARSSVKLAIKHATENDDPKLPEYRSQLKNISQ